MEGSCNRRVNKSRFRYRLDGVSIRFGGDGVWSSTRDNLSTERVSGYLPISSSPCSAFRESQIAAARTAVAIRMIVIGKWQVGRRVRRRGGASDQSRDVSDAHVLRAPRESRFTFRLRASWTRVICSCAAPRENNALNSRLDSRIINRN